MSNVAIIQTSATEKKDFL